MLQIKEGVFLPLTEIELTATRSQGAGGQNINKVSTAIHLRFNVAESSLLDEYKERLLHIKDSRITVDGIIVIKAQRYRSQEQNKLDAFDRLAKMIRKVTFAPKKRKKTKPSKRSVKKRLDTKAQRGDLKKLRKTPE